MCGASIPLAAGIWSSVFFIASGSLGVAGNLNMGAIAFVARVAPIINCSFSCYSFEAQYTDDGVIRSF